MKPQLLACPRPAGEAKYLIASLATGGSAWQTNRLAFMFCCLLAGCSSMSGYDAKTSFACEAPDGVLCQSLTGIYANVEAKALPGQRKGGSSAATGAAEAQATARSDALAAPLSSGTPIRSSPKVMRIWLAPWKDSDGDLHDQSYLYLAVDQGDWLIAHNQRRIADAYRPVRAAARAATGVEPPSKPAAQQSGSVDHPVDSVNQAVSDGMTRAGFMDARDIPALRPLPKVPGSDGGN